MWNLQGSIVGNITRGHVSVVFACVHIKYDYCVCSGVQTKVFIYVVCVCLFMYVCVNVFKLVYDIVYTGGVFV